MLRFVTHRFLLMIPTLLGVAVLVFLLLRLMPGDPVRDACCEAAAPTSRRT